MQGILVPIVSSKNFSRPSDNLAVIPVTCFQGKPGAEIF